ncbi:hypothetical protein MTR67_015123 [Solanum verrucosum]|uniref:Uncharacterized protein n=1 Tax=Solanum verrucosum TaxID=315347 RepID=A0AAF0QFS8_SOLVR|nr:hypothetical protein MTR67_015123 [Solanum verrucosum]
MKANKLKALQRAAASTALIKCALIGYYKEHRTALPKPFYRFLDGAQFPLARQFQTPPDLSTLPLNLIPYLR